MRTTEVKPLFNYYLIASANSIAATLFLYCSYFWARQEFGYSDAENLAMGAAQGLTAIVTARYGGRLGDRIGYTRLIMSALPLLPLALIAGSLFHFRALPIVLSSVYIGLISSTWPSVEASAMHAPSKLSMPKRLGIYNVTWSFSGASGYFLGGVIFARDPRGILWIPALLHLALWGWLAAQRNSTPSHHSSAMEVAHEGRQVSPERKKVFLHTAWFANAAAYFLATSFLALAPQLGERFGLPASHAIWLACSLLFARGIAFVVFWSWSGWHYRMRWSHAALWLAPLCMIGIYFSGWIPLVVACFVCFGLASGLTYFTSIYYSLDYGESKGEHGGLHESILAYGILLGPLVGAIGARVFGGTVGAQWTLIVTCLLMTGVGAAVVSRPRENHGSR